jgi:hypothetical protein
MPTEMSIKETKEQIADLKWAHFVNQNDGTSPIEVPDLKALADSHTALLEAAKGIDEYVCQDSDMAFRIMAAVEQAEQL